MLTTYRKAYNTTVYAQMEKGKLPVGLFIDLVINPDNGTAFALWVQTLQGKKMLDPHDIIQWRSSEILIREPDNCYDPEPNPKLKKIFAKECAVLGADVYRLSDGKRIGQVRNFGFDTISPRILSLHVQPRWWEFWHKQIIPHSRIDQITAKGIFVNDQAAIKAAPPLKKVSGAIKSEIPKVDCED